MQLSSLAERPDADKNLAVPKNLCNFLSRLIISISYKATEYRNTGRLDLPDMPYRIIDTYPAFKKCWRKTCSWDLDGQITAWEKEYMAEYPELFRLQVKSYAEIGIDWRSIARERIFPKLPGLLPLIEETWRKLRTIIPDVYRRFTNFWNQDFDVVFTIYVGIGCGAGWATEYMEQYAVLLGLENIAEQRWHRCRELEGLLAHELSHIAHMVLRGSTAEEFEKLEANPLFLLYSEGFAMRGEHHLTGERWRIASDAAWLKWCRENMGLLALEYLRRVDKGVYVNDFFGSWLEVEGRSQTGYFLGHELVKSLEETLSLREIALLDTEEVMRRTREFLENAIQKSRR